MTENLKNKLFTWVKMYTCIRTHTEIYTSMFCVVDRDYPASLTIQPELFSLCHIGMVFKKYSFACTCMYLFST